MMDFHVPDTDDGCRMLSFGERKGRYIPRYVPTVHVYTCPGRVGTGSASHDRDRATTGPLKRVNRIGLGGHVRANVNRYTCTNYIEDTRTEPHRIRRWPLAGKRVIGWLLHAVPRRVDRFVAAPMSHAAASNQNDARPPRGSMALPSLDSSACACACAYTYAVRSSWLALRDSIRCLALRPCASSVRGGSSSAARGR
jgi:hypothetical protein